MSDGHNMLVLDDVKVPSDLNPDGTPVPQVTVEDADGALVLEQDRSHEIAMPTGPAPNWIEIEAFKPAIGMDEALGKVFDKYGMERLGGASGRGWSSRSKLMKCPYLFQQSFLVKAEALMGRSALNLETGSCYHAFLALGYVNLMAGAPKPGETQLKPSVLKKELLDVGASAEAIMEAWRLFTGYAARYQYDCIKPIAVEQFAKDEDSGNTCRYDLIAEVNDLTGTIVVPGTYIIEHKTASRFDRGTLEGWFNDGEVLGQIMIWNKAKLHKKYGKLQGVIVNLVSKTKEPAFERVVVPVEVWQIKQHESDLRMLDMEEALYRATGIWPRRRSSCVGRFGLCELFDFCANRHNT